MRRGSTGGLKRQTRDDNITLHPALLSVSPAYERTIIHKHSMLHLHRPGTGLPLSLCVCGEGSAHASGTELQG